MVKFGKFITKHKLFILILGVLLIIPSMIGMVKTRVNYDVLSYLPDSLRDSIRSGYHGRRIWYGGIFHGYRGKYG